MASLPRDGKRGTNFLTRTSRPRSGANRLSNLERERERERERDARESHLDLMFAQTSVSSIMFVCG